MLRGFHSRLSSKTPQIGIVLGSVCVIMGFVYRNSGIWLLGFILLGLGLAIRVHRGT